MDFKINNFSFRIPTRIAFRRKVHVQLGSFVFHSEQEPMETEPVIEDMMGAVPALRGDARLLDLVNKVAQWKEESCEKVTLSDLIDWGEFMGSVGNGENPFTL